MKNSNALYNKIVWRPSEETINRSNLKAFMDLHKIRSFDELMKKSTSDISWFTDAILKFLRIEFQEPYSRVVDLSRGVQFPKWCVGGKMNITCNCIDKWAENPETGDHTAFVWEAEDGRTKKFSYKELCLEVNRCANALRQLGFKKGDVIGLFMPMIPEIAIAFFAIAKIGGIILPLFSGFGVTAIVSRLNDAKAKAVFTAGGLLRRGKIVPLKSTLDEALKEVSGVENVIVKNYCGNKVKMNPGFDLWWDELVPQQSAESETEITSAEDLLMIIYTSGTTGKPKGAVHTHCGFPVKAAQDMAFGTDVHPDDLIYWMTDMGWMMGPWLLLGATVLGSTFFLYDGAPDFPDPARLWALVERHKISVLGISPSLIRALMVHGDAPVKQHNISSIRAFASTSEPWNPDPWMWLFNSVGNGKLPIINYSGGTEISGGILMGNPILPLKPTAFSGPCPGIAADVLNERGNSVRNRIGELVIRNAWIGMTRGFWQDKQRYLDSYWSRWKNIWQHGDLARVDEDGMWYILGRSDDTLKIAGKRVGPAEIESVLVNHATVVEAAAIGIPDEIKGNALISFCVLKPETENLIQLKSELKSLVAKEMGKPLRPKEIYFVSDLPKTRNAKVMRRMIRAAYLAEEIGDTSSLVNPESVKEIGNLTSSKQS